MRREAVKILYLAANPKDTSSLRLDAEIRGIKQALLQAEFRDEFHIEQEWAVRVADLQSCLLRHKPDIVHFSGHGSAAGEILLENAVGNSQAVSVHALEQLFSVFKDGIRCVVLNACYSTPQAQAIAKNVDCVVGMSKAIGDEAAISFAIAFYQALAFGKDVKTAFDSGCVEIDLEGLNEQDTPKLLAMNCDPHHVIFIQTQSLPRQSHSGSTGDSKRVTLGALSPGASYIVLSGDRAGQHAETVFEWFADHQLEAIILAPRRPDRDFRLPSTAESIQEILFIIDLNEIDRATPEEKDALRKIYNEACTRDCNRMIFIKGRDGPGLGEWEPVLQADNQRGISLVEQIAGSEEIIARLRWSYHLSQIQRIIPPPMLPERDEDELRKETAHLKGEPAAKDNVISVLTQWTLEYFNLDKTWLGHVLFRRADVAKLSSYLYTATKIFSWLGLALGEEDVYEPPESLPNFRILGPHFYTCLPSCEIEISWKEMREAAKYQVEFKDEYGKTLLSQVTKARALLLSEVDTQHRHLNRSCLYTWLVRAIDAAGQIIDESDVQGAFFILNDETAEYLKKDIEALPRDEEPAIQGFLRGLCWRCYGCRLHAAQAYQEALAIRGDFLPAVNGIIECLEGSYADLSERSWYTGERWDEIAEMYKLRRCLLLNKYHIRSQRQCASCQACLDRRDE